MQTFVWKTHLAMYREQRALRFESKEELDRLIDLLWTDEVLYDMPHTPVGYNTIIVPAEAVEYLRKKGIRFTELPVVSAAELPPERLNKLRREQGIF